jgi:hypothetical protein
MRSALLCILVVACMLVGMFLPAEAGPSNGRPVSSLEQVNPEKPGGPRKTGGPHKSGNADGGKAVNRGASARGTMKYSPKKHIRKQRHRAKKS